ncbi:MAG TPA: PQQ-binding-like beta-propeller repeat protein [Gemmataceae bacterium]|jgi:outer membrane protein assembly factor BamB
MRALTCLTLALLAAATAPAGDWPQWLGPNRDGASAEVVKPWTDAPKILWRTAVGSGHSSPIVAGGRVYLHSKAAGKDAERLVAYDVADGKEVAAADMARDPFASPFGAGPRATPVGLPGGGVVGYGVTGQMIGLAAADKPLPFDGGWPNPVKQFHAPIPKFGVSSSPLADGDRVIVMVGGKGASLVAYKSGQIAWKALDDPASYASPIVTEHAGKRQLVALTAEGVVSLDPASGELFWRYPFKDLIAESSTTPLRVGDLIIASSVTLGSVGLKLGTKDGKPAVTEAWKNPALSCYFSTPVTVGDKYLYMVTGSIVAAMRRQPQADLNCVEAATGKVLWKREKVGKYHAALIRTGDGKLLLHSDTGELMLLDPDPKEYRELARAKVCGPTWAHPALANGRLYVRDDKELVCVRLGE